MSFFSSLPCLPGVVLYPLGIDMLKQGSNASCMFFFRGHHKREGLAHPADMSPAETGECQEPGTGATYLQRSLKDQAVLTFREVLKTVSLNTHDHLHTISVFVV